MHELRRHPPQPVIANRATQIPDDITSAAGGQHSDAHPVHVRITWRHFDDTETVEQQWGLLTAWAEGVMRVHFWRHGEHWVWFARDDVTPCTCTDGCDLIHSPA